MFTGIVEQVGRIAKIRKSDSGATFVVHLERPVSRVRPGASVCVSGVCLTATHRRPRALTFDVVPETLKKTYLGRLRAGDAVNIEFSLRSNSEVGGHWVTGHVDGTGRIARKDDIRGERKIWIKVGKSLARMLVTKGSVAVDGVSLTVVDVRPDRFSVALIPFTLKHTILGLKEKGAVVNVEADLIGKYVARYLGRR